MIRPHNPANAPASVGGEDRAAVRRLDLWASRGDRLAQAIKLKVDASTADNFRSAAAKKIEAEIRRRRSVTLGVGSNSKYAKKIKELASYFVLMIEASFTNLADANDKYFEYAYTKLSDEIDDFIEFGSDNDEEKLATLANNETSYGNLQDFIRTLYKGLTDNGFTYEEAVTMSRNIIDRLKNSKNYDARTLSWSTPEALADFALASFFSGVWGLDRYGSDTINVDSYANGKAMSLPADGQPKPYPGKRAGGLVRNFLTKAYPYNAETKPLTLAWLRVNDIKAFKALANQSDATTGPPSAFLTSRSDESSELLARHGIELTTPEGKAEARRVYQLLNGRIFKRNLE